MSFLSSNLNAVAPPRELYDPDRIQAPRKTDDLQARRVEKTVHDLICDTGVVNPQEAKKINRDFSPINKKKYEEAPNSAEGTLNPAKKVKCEDSNHPSIVTVLPDFDDNPFALVQGSCIASISEENEEGKPDELDIEGVATDMDEFVDIPLEIIKEGCFEENTKYFKIRGMREGDLEFEIIYQSDGNANPSFIIRIPKYVPKPLREYKIEMIITTFTLSAFAIADEGMWHKFDMQQIKELLGELIKLSDSTFKNDLSKVSIHLKRSIDNLKKYIIKSYVISYSTK